MISGAIYAGVPICSKIYLDSFDIFLDIPKSQILTYWSFVNNILSNFISLWRTLWTLCK